MRTPPTASGKRRSSIVKLLFDQNLSPRLVRLLADLHPDCSHVATIGLDQASDAEVWDRAHHDGYAIVTKDSDFGDLGVLRGFPPKVIWVRLGNCTNRSRSYFAAIMRQ